MIESLDLGKRQAFESAGQSQDSQHWTDEQLDDLWWELIMCERNIKDKNAWVRLANEILQAAGFHSTRSHPGLFSVESIQTQSILSGLLPRRKGDGSAISKRTHLAIAIESCDRSETDLLDTAQHLGSVSQMSDAYTKRRPMVHAVEVKQAPSDAKEAHLQLAIWNIAGMTQLSRILSVEADQLKPFFGWTALGPE